MCLKLDQKEPKLLFELVCEEIENAISLIINDLFDASDVEELINILFLPCIAIVVNTVSVWTNNKYALRNISVEKFWLHFQRHFEFVKNCYITAIEVHLEYTVFFTENYWVDFWGVFKVELWAYTVEKIYIFHNNFVVEFKFIFWALLYFFEDKKLVMLLLVFDEVLTTDAAQEFLAVWILHANDFIGFSSNRF